MSCDCKNHEPVKILKCKKCGAPIRIVWSCGYEDLRPSHKHFAGCSGKQKVKGTINDLAELPHVRKAMAFV